MKKNLRVKFFLSFLVMTIVCFIISNACIQPGGKDGGGKDGKSNGVSETGCLLTIKITGSGIVNKTPSSQYYSTGTNVTVTALPNSGYAFDRWEGDLTASVNQASLFMNTNKTVTAVFVKSTSRFNLTINVNGSGSVLKNPVEPDYLSGTSVALTAAPDAGHVFDHWEGDLSGTESNSSINMSGNDKTITAVFAALYDLDVSVNPIDSGDVAISPDQINYKNGTVVSISALPKPGYAFDHWEGVSTGSTNPASINMDNNKSILAVFVESTARYNLNTSVTGSGTIVKNPDQSDYLTGTTVTVTATPNSGSIFDHWEGDITGNLNPVSINMNSIKNITAVFIGPRGTLEGTVVESLGGSPVRDAIITVSGTNKTAITDSNGYFNIINIPVGNYDLNVSKNGMAGSKLQSVYILDGQTTKVELIETIYDFSSTQITPPTISVTGLTKENTYSGTVPITINVSAGSFQVIGTGNHASIYLKIGSNTSAIEDSISTNNVLSYNWNSSSYPSGYINIKIISYDINNNRSEINIPVIVNSASGAVPSTKPTSDYYEFQALTFGTSIGLFKQQKKSFNLTLGNKSKTLSSSDNVIMSAPDNSSIIVEIWMYYYYGNGMTVLRSNSKNGTYTEVGKTKYYESKSSSYLFVDYSSDLTPGQTYWYKIAYFNNYGNGPFSDPVSVKILPNYNLDLVSPANNSVLTDNTPALTWVTGNISGITRYDWIEIREIVSNTIVYATASNSPMMNTTQFTTNALDYNKQYEWDIVHSEFFYRNSAYVYSASFPSSGGNSNNGRYTFSVVKP